MDKRRSGKEILEEVTRESLIALSYTEPEKDAAASSISSGRTPNGVKPVRRVDHDVAEKYRSELISISYSQPPDGNSLPHAQK